MLILMDPRHHDVIDIRVWQVLNAIDAVKTNPGAVGFRSRQRY
jgi:hypothetical protein